MQEIEIGAPVPDGRPLTRAHKQAAWQEKTREAFQSCTRIEGFVYIAISCYSEEDVNICKLIDDVLDIAHAERIFNKRRIAYLIFNHGRFLGGKPKCIIRFSQV